MKRLALLGGVVVAFFVSLVVSAGFSGSAAAPAKATFTVVSQDSEGTFTPADFFASPPVQNAQASIDAPIYRSGQKVGQAETIVTITRVAGDDVAAMVECSVELPEGNILFNGSAHFADLGTGAELPVVGGTGRYAGAAGVVSMVAAADGTSTELSFEIRTKP
jgi:hypothetical protein